MKHLISNENRNAIDRCYNRNTQKNKFSENSVLNHLKSLIEGYIRCSRPNGGISILDQAYGDQDHDQLSNQQVSYKT